MKINASQLQHDNAFIKDATGTPRVEEFSTDIKGRIPSLCIKLHLRMRIDDTAHRMFWQYTRCLSQFGGGNQQTSSASIQPLTLGKRAHVILSAMADIGPPVRLLIILNDDNSVRLELRNGIPNSMEELIEEVNNSCGLEDILEKLADKVYTYKAYPTDADFSDVAEALTSKHPCLKEPGSFNESYGWKQRMKVKIANYRTLLRTHGTSAELAVNSSKTKSQEESYPAKNLKRARQAEANHFPSLPIDKLLQVIRSRGGVVKQKTTGILQVLDETVDITIRRECILKSLMIYLGEPVDHLIKEFQEAEAGELEQATMAIFVIGKEDQFHRPKDVKVLIDGTEVLIDGTEVLNGLPSVATAFAMLFALIYALNLRYPKELQSTFEVVQKVLMELEGKKMSPKVNRLRTQLFIPE
ncbi:hypothetical protein NQZ68_012433 [Dissostichus eleginoides]|nr:hypothetical protein NQZ68_012433 [Dissostichus eleginoides]